MLTPIDIQNKTFDVKLRGYSSQEVDDFMDLLIKDYETMYQENLSLKEKLKVLTDAIDQYKKMEETLQSSIILAQTAAEETKRTAQSNAESIVNDAKVKAEAMVNEATVRSNDIIHKTNDELAKIRGEIINSQKELTTYKTRVKGFCNSILEMLEEIE